MDVQADEEPTGPSVESEDAEERVLARRLRIQKRQEAQKKYAVLFHSDVVYLLLGLHFFFHNCEAFVSEIF